MCNLYKKEILCLIKKVIKSTLYIIRMLSTGSAVMYFSRFVLEEYNAFLLIRQEVPLTARLEIYVTLLDSSLFQYLPLICMIILFPLVISKKEHTAFLIYDSILGLTVLFDIRAYDLLASIVKRPF